MTIRTVVADLAAAVEENERLRWSLAKVITLADEAPRMTDEQLRARLEALGWLLRPGPPRGDS